jgi:hypothetical protein
VFLRNLLPCEPSIPQPPTDDRGFGFLPQLDEFYFTTAEKKICKSEASAVRGWVEIASARRKEKKVSVIKRVLYVNER